MKLHPLLNIKSPHYGNDKDATIYKMYKEYTEHELLAWCKISAEKYIARKGKKQGESEQDNHEKYASFYYTALLLECSICYKDPLAKDILMGNVTECELAQHFDDLCAKATHTIPERMMFDILEYMSRF